MGNLRRSTVGNNEVRNARMKMRIAMNAYGVVKDKAEMEYDTQVREALHRAREHFGNKKFTAGELADFLGNDISRNEIASWMRHKTWDDKYPAQRFTSDLSFRGYRLPKGAKRCGKREIIKRVAELDENNQVIPETIQTIVHYGPYEYTFGE